MFAAKFSAFLAEARLRAISRPHRILEGYSVRKVLQREYDVPAGLPKVEITISFYPEAALYRPNVSPLEINHLVGSLDSSGAIKISRRVLGLADDEPKNRDLVVMIVVNGVERCFRKAKHPEAEAVGVLYARAKTIHSISIKSLQQQAEGGILG